MSLRTGFSLFVFALLAPSTTSSACQEDHVGTLADVESSPQERSSPASFTWADFDGDGLLDLAAVGGDGRLRLLASVGDDRFEDGTERVGLAGVSNAALALWGDYDGDLRLDLFIGARDGQSRLFHNEGGFFVDMSAGSGLEVEGAVQSAHWLDHDVDGRLDLHVVTAEKNALFHGLEGGFFEATDLPLPGSARRSSSESSNPLPTEPSGTTQGDAPPSSAETASTPRSEGDLELDGSRRTQASSPHLGSTAGGRTSGGSTSAPAMAALVCASSIKDQATPGSCLEASTTPTLGKLYPISSSLFVAVGGNVGIGTTTPAAKLEVAGTARVTDTLTLDPPGDVALDVVAGSIYMGGALFIHTQGSFNTAIGRDALASVTTGGANTASGDHALFFNTTGSSNTASGSGALYSNTAGSFNTASGLLALFSNTTGSFNTASGFRALYSNVTANSNTASGYRALSLNTTGSRNTAHGSKTLVFSTANDNVASGYEALYSNTTGSQNTASGSSALRNNTAGSNNTASGYAALFDNTIGGGNTANGYAALTFTTTGGANTASGASALRSNTTGNGNTALGYSTLRSNSTGYLNTACGRRALENNTTGIRNIALGNTAGYKLTTGNDNIAIGSSGVAGETATMRLGSLQTRTFIAGVRGVTTGNANAIPVLIDSNGQLGTVSSSRRFKEEIRDMGELTERLLELRPVVFRYRSEVQHGERPLEYGLIAEEVAEVFPELVVNDDEGKPFTVKYHLLAAMLLNELEKQDERVEACERDLRELQARVMAIDVGLQSTRRSVPR